MLSTYLRLLHTRKKKKNSENNQAKSERRTASFCLPHLISQDSTALCQKETPYPERVPLTLKEKRVSDQLPNILGQQTKDLLWFQPTQRPAHWSYIERYLEAKKKSRASQCQPCSRSSCSEELHRWFQQLFSTEETNGQQAIVAPFPACPTVDFTMLCLRCIHVHQHQLSNYLPTPVLPPPSEPVNLWLLWLHGYKMPAQIPMADSQLYMYLRCASPAVHLYTASLIFITSFYHGMHTQAKILLP